jgi:hypothetical protein
MEYIKRLLGFGKKTEPSKLEDKVIEKKNICKCRIQDKTTEITEVSDYLTQAPLIQNCDDYSRGLFKSGGALFSDTVDIESKLKGIDNPLTKYDTEVACTPLNTSNPSVCLDSLVLHKEGRSGNRVSFSKNERLVSPYGHGGPKNITDESVRGGENSREIQRKRNKKIGKRN